MSTTKHWQAKVFAFIHDPAEKSLILFRGKGHEAGTVAMLKERLKKAAHDLPDEDAKELEAFVRKGDWWASAADRPSLPKEQGRRVNFDKNPELIHPLSGEKVRLQSLELDLPPKDLEADSFAHYDKFIVQENGRLDWKKTFLSLWRFAPCAPTKALGALWSQLPADTRSPDHSIWEHLSLTSAFAGALAAGETHGPALLLMSFGPVQGFIAQARSVSDLWAGSHLLSRLAWVAMKEVCDRYGPDAVLFPNLHGVPQVDLWLYETLGPVWREIFDAFKGKIRDPEWMSRETDANPLFVAALPNRFVALVPAQEAEELAKDIAEKVRRWVRNKAFEGLEELLRVAGIQDALDAHAQLDRQLKNFPEIYWAVVPWILAGETRLDDQRLREALQVLGASPSYLDDALESVLKNPLVLDGVTFYRPNPGVAYPGLIEALERLHAAAKGARAMSGDVEEGYRCSLCGEREWLAHRRGEPTGPSGIFSPPGRRHDTLWKRVSSESQALAKDGEHLCGWCALKRTWPRLFTEEVGRALGTEKPDRLVLSTHGMAVATSLWRWAESQPNNILSPEVTRALKSLSQELQRLAGQAQDTRPVLLPAKLHRKLKRKGWPSDTIRELKRIPALLDALDSEDKQRQAVRAFKRCFGTAPETYYALVLMDGDRMGQWLSATGKTPKLEQRFHSECLEDLRSVEALRAYLNARRPASPAWHQSISSALNAFSIHVSRRIVEDLFMGKLIYAGGDDLMAMVAVHDLPALMFALRCAFSGQLPAGEDNQSFWRKLGTDDGTVKFHFGYGLVDSSGDRQLYRLMGETASASMGAVIAHHQAPLPRVLTELRAAEQRAKKEGKRDAFCLTVCKRSGGTEHLVGKWNLTGGWRDGDMGLLLDLRHLLAYDVSRRTAYELSEVFRDVPPDEKALAAVMDYQFRRKAKVSGTEARDLAERLARRAVSRNGVEISRSGEWAQPNRFLRDMVLTAEFLAREGRVGQQMEKAEEVP
ncbi:CRISPR-associated Cmr2 family protein [Desulfosoma caldarium]|uniref:CRISPR-associated Cmr2 family protein n=1 Tax=Desulfosoma caldarium TaxID=610254 RepID=A0A3N1UVX2_9BACT|nr:CRISPR-associated Cmr2 family protein [Desulfosoma caldarium]